MADPTVGPTTYVPSVTVTVDLDFRGVERHVSLTPNQPEAPFWRDWS